MKKRRDKRDELGQGAVELALVLPVLILLLIGVAEMGYLLRNYLVVVNADREACRFAARGRYTDERIIERAISAGGAIRINGQDVPFLRTHGTEPNAAVIVTHIPMDVSGDIDPISITTAVSGVVSSGESYTMTYVQPSDSGISLTQISEHQSDATQEINAERAAAGYEQMENQIVVVEIFFIHRPVWGGLLNTLSAGIVSEGPWIMRVETKMRVVKSRGG